jgi:hypothetical protein
MRTRLPALVLVVVVLGTALSGCGYRRSMKRAERNVEAEHWREAVVEYRSALQRKPESLDAQLGLDAVRTPAFHEALADGRQALSRREFEAAMDHAAFAAGLLDEHEGVKRLRADVREAMRIVLDDLIEGGAMEQAYPFADRLGTLFPTAEFLHGAYDRLRSHFFDRAEDLLDRKQYAEALEQLTFIDTFEPDLADEVEARSAEVRGAWADDLVARASDKGDHDRTGAAAVLLAAAHQVAGRETDLARARRLAHALRVRGHFSVDLRIEGRAVDRAWTREQAEQGVEAFPGARVVPEEADPWFTWTIRPGPTTCVSTDEVTRAEHDYVAGQTNENNPDYLALLERGDRLKRDLDALVVELAGARRTLERTSQELGEHETEVMRPLWDEIQAHRHEIVELESSTLTPKARRRLDELEGLVAELLAQDEGVAEDHRTLRAACDGARFHLERLIERDEELREVRDEVDAQLEATPPLVYQDVIETLHYDVHHWTRTCSAELTVRARGRWGPGLEADRVFTGTRHTADATHAGHPVEGVVEDPLDFPLTDADLSAGAHTDNLDLALQALDVHADAFYAFWWNEARNLRDVDPDRATDAMLMVYLGAPRRNSDRDRAWIADHVLRVYGLESLELLE